MALRGIIPSLFLMKLLLLICERYRLTEHSEVNNDINSDTL